MHIHMYIAPTPLILLRPNYMQQAIIGEAHDLICLIALSSKVQPHLVNLTWNFTGTDDRIVVIPTNITIDDSIGIVYTTVIQFAYIMEGDGKNYSCALTIEGDTTESIFNLEIISKYGSIHISLEII